MNARQVLRVLSRGILLVIFALGLLAGVVTHYSYAFQFRELPNSSPSALHLLGTDQLGRDVFTRVLYGTRISLLLAPGAALLTTCIAAISGGIAGLCGGWLEKFIL